MRAIFKMLLIGTMTAGSLALSPAFAADEEQIEVSADQISLDEVATVYYLSKLCPPLVDDKKKFAKAYAVELKNILPNESNPQAAIEKMAKDKDFQQKLTEIAQFADKFGTEENTAMCQEISNYQY